MLNRLHAFWVNRHPLVRLMTGLVVAAGLVWWLAPMAADVYRGVRAERQTANAATALKRGDYAEARDLSLRVLRFQPENRRALTLMMTAADHLNDFDSTRAAFGVLLADGDDEEFDPAIREEAWEIVVRRAPTATLFSFWTSLPEGERTRESRLVAVLDRLIGEKHTEIVGEILDRPSVPQTPAIEFCRLRWLALRDSDESRTELVRGLVKALYDHPEESQWWTELLSRVGTPEVSEREARQIVGLLTPLADAGPRHALQLARFRMIASRSEAGPLYERALESFGEESPWITARWCLALDRPDDAARLIALDIPAAEPERFELQLALLKATRGVATVAEFLETAAEEADRIDSALWLARAARLRNQAKERSAAAEKALEAALASTDPEAPLRLARRAESAGLDDLAVDAWLAAFRRGVGPLPLSWSVDWVFEELVREQREDDLFAFLTAIRQLEPGNRGNTEIHAYLALVKGFVQPASVIESFSDLGDRPSLSRAAAGALALAYLLEERSEEAAALLDDPDIDWFAANPNLRALRAIALVRRGETEEAEVFLEDFPWSELFPSERRVFQGLLETSE